MVTEVLTYVFGGVAVFLVGMSAVSWLVTRRRKAWPTVTGRVTHLEEGRGGENDPDWWAVVAYSTPVGAGGSLRVGQTSERVGDPVELRYDPARPERAVLRGRENEIATMSIGMAVAFGLVAAGCHYFPA